MFNLHQKVLTLSSLGWIRNVNIFAGGVAIGGQPNLPEGHAGLGDKIIGKTQKVDLESLYTKETD